MSDIALVALRHLTKYQLDVEGSPEICSYLAVVVAQFLLQAVEKVHIWISWDRMIDR
jgi:hypothetical protein